MLKTVGAKLLDLAFYLNPYQKLTVSNLGCDLSSIQVLWKFHSVFFCVILLTNQQTNQPTYGHCQECSFLGGGIHDKLCDYNLFRSYSF